MRLEQSRLEKIKNYLHAAQLGLIFLAIILTIAVYTRNGPSDGRTGWYFALCWLTIPALVYLVMVPMWSRTEKFANPYALAVLDGLLVVLWLSAWAAVAAYVSAGGGCGKFSLGSNGKCKLSEGTVFLGVFIMVLFAGTSYISFKSAMEFRRTGIMPRHKASDFEVQTQDAFSSNMQKDDFDEDGEGRPGSDPSYDDAQAPSVFDPTSYGQSRQYEPLAHQNDYEDLGQAPLAGLGVRYSHPAVEDEDTGYSGSYGHQRLP